MHERGGIFRVPARGDGRGDQRCGVGVGFEVRHIDDVAARGGTQRIERERWATRSFQSTGEYVGRRSARWIQEPLGRLGIPDASPSGDRGQQQRECAADERDLPTGRSNQQFRRSGAGEDRHYENVASRP